jgi:hypothetical protein
MRRCHALQPASCQRQLRIASRPNYLKAQLDGRTTVEFLQTKGHLSTPGLLAQVLGRALARY